MKHEYPQPFARNHESLLKRLKLRGMQPKTIESYSHGVRRAAAYFDYVIDDLNKDQLTDYFAQILDHLSWSTLQHDLYGLKFYYAHVLDKPWPAAEFTKAPKVSRLPDIVTVAQMQQIINAMRVLSYRVLFFTLYNTGLHLGEGLQLRVGDLDAQRMRVHVRDAKGNRDRLVPLPAHTLEVLRAFWKEHRNPVLLFPSRPKGLAGAASATTHVDCGAVQQALRQFTAQEWVVHCKAVGSGQKALVYLGRYLYRGVLPEKSIVANRNGNVTFRCGLCAHGRGARGMHYAAWR